MSNWNVILNIITLFITLISLLCFLSTRKETKKKKKEEEKNKVNNKKIKQIDETKLEETITMWKMGLGDMNKYLKGENPLPKKTIKATSDSWECREMNNYINTECNIILTSEEFQILSMGHIPEAMEDHWFMYCDENSVNYFRSWTGIQIFKGFYKSENDQYVIYSLEINDNKEEYNEPEINKSIQLFNYLITAECKTY